LFKRGQNEKITYVYNNVEFYIKLSKRQYPANGGKIKNDKKK
jgi:hypothetical protein